MICNIRLDKNGEMILSSNGQEIITHSLKCKEINSGYMSPGAMFMGALAGCKVLTFMKSAKYYKIKFEDLNIEVEAYVVSTDNIGDTPFKNQEYSEIRTKYSLKTDASIDQLDRVINLANKICTVNLAVDKNIKQFHTIELL
ncbi:MULTISPECIES: OsmC family protein [unclassified Parvimonas]|uniref:OsmC family protein n=1 Tax=unclassified Parvimonas TaxID=1151464 RepID=UPI0039E335B5